MKTESTQPKQTYDYDLFTIGAGSGGVRASRMASNYGARVAVAEERYLGGTCVNVGCVPKKLMVYAAHVSEDLENATGFGWSVGDSKFDWPTFIANKNREIERLNGIYASILEGAGVEQLDGTARIVAPHTVQVGDRTVTARHVLVATGSWPRLPDTPGIEHAITSNEAFHLDALPRRALIVGGGYIAVEFAGILQGMGSDVSLLYRGDLFLRGFDHDVRETLKEELTQKGVDLRFNTNVTQIEKSGDRLRVTLDNDQSEEADQILYAIGRVPKSADLGLEEVGVELAADGSVVVNEYSQSSVPWIHAIGDVTNRINLTPVAIAEGMALASTLFQDKPTTPDYEHVPSAVFSQPPVGNVGLTEEEARARYSDVHIYRSRFRAMKHSLTDQDERTMMKLVVDGDSDRVLGVHMVGPDAGEIIQGFAVALKCGATKAQFDATVGVHPTSAEEFVTMRERVESPKS